MQAIANQGSPPIENNTPIANKTSHGFLSKISSGFKKAFAINQYFALEDMKLKLSSSDGKINLRAVEPERKFKLGNKEITAENFAHKLEAKVNKPNFSQKLGYKFALKIEKSVNKAEPSQAKKNELAAIVALSLMHAKQKLTPSIVILLGGLIGGAAGGAIGSAAFGAGSVPGILGGIGVGYTVGAGLLAGFTAYNSLKDFENKFGMPSITPETPSPAP